MRQVLWLLVMGSLLVGLSFAGLAGDEDPEKTAVGFGFGGPLIGFFTVELDSINRILEANGYGPLAARMAAFGGGGGGGLVGGCFFGGRGWGGSVTSIRAGKKAELSVGFGGMDMAYVVGGNDRSLLLIGAVLGGGGLDLELRERIPTSFEDAVADPTSTTLSQGFFAAEPYAGFLVQPSSWLGLEFHLGYLFSLGAGWEEGGQTIEGPALDLRGPLVGLSIFFGGIEREAREEAIEEPKEEVPEDSEG